ncbi:adenylate cyclase type 3 [Folsomia candida]|nr:adenylate cyclase type 3 [Folsomia candida]
MGLAVVEAIKVFQKRTNSNVDMRVGIHTGAVLAGVLGQRQWQFDVYSEDVTLANKMESSGRPGRVHISNKTLEFLNGQFEVEPGDGDAQEEKLRMAGIKTFFITKVLVPFVDDSVEEKKTKKGQGNDNSYGERLEAHLSLQQKNFAKSVNKVTLQFKDTDKEKAYAKVEDPSNGKSFFGLTCIVAATAAASALIISFQTVGFTSASLTIITVSVIGLWIMTGRSAFLGKMLARSVLTIVCVIVAVATNFSYLVPCFQAGSIKSRNSSALTTRQEVVKHWADLSCSYPAYFSVFLALCLFGLSIMSNTASWLKIIASALITLMGITVINLGSIHKAYSYSEIFSFPDGFDLVLESAQAGIFLLLIFALMCWLNRQLDSSSRSLFLQKHDVGRLGEQAVALRERNEALMCNIMPQHVAEHFLDKTQNHDQLYSHNYQEVGVVFASMPNFSDFYTEDAVNNQGLECLRFLNEVISDYDAILDYPKFKDNIIKIKTIGSTYMAASGLNPNNQVQPGEVLRERWRHLSLLVEFVFEMKNVLDRINKESYNQFVLRIGVNHGPVTAGVIGATKPAYDMWGNSVNVASRMESTGKAGKMQVTEECYKILRMYGYEFELRGYVSVKGKGDLLTYFLIGVGKGELSDEELEALEKQEADSVPLPPAEG